MSYEYYTFNPLFYCINSICFKFFIYYIQTIGGWWIHNFWAWIIFWIRILVDIPNRLYISYLQGDQLNIAVFFEYRGQILVKYVY